MTSTSSDKFTESARLRLTLFRARFEELMSDFQAFHDRLEKRLESSSEGLQGVPLSSLPPSDSQAA